MGHLALGNPGLALKDLNRALRLNPNLPVASRARDGSAALQMALDGDYRHAHVRLNVLLHPRAAGSSNPMIEAAGASQGLDGLPQLFLNHELVLYRGVCSLYLGDSAAAAQTSRQHSSSHSRPFRRYSRQGDATTIKMKVLTTQRAQRHWQVVAIATDNLRVSIHQR